MPQLDQRLLRADLNSRELTFAVFVNDVPLPRGTPPSREGKVLGKLAEIIQQNAP